MLLLQSCVALAILLTLLGDGRMREVKEQGGSGIHCPWLGGAHKPPNVFMR